MGYNQHYWLIDLINQSVTHFVSPPHFPADSIVWVIFNKPTLSAHNPHCQSISLVYQRPMSHIFKKPTLSVDKPGLSNSKSGLVQ